MAYRKMLALEQSLAHLSNFPTPADLQLAMDKYVDFWRGAIKSLKENQSKSA